MCDVKHEIGPVHSSVKVTTDRSMSRLSCLNDQRFLKQNCKLAGARGRLRWKRSSLMCARLDSDCAGSVLDQCKSEAILYAMCSKLAGALRLDPPCSRSCTLRCAGGGAATGQALHQRCGAVKPRLQSGSRGRCRLQALSEQACVPCEEGSDSLEFMGLCEALSESEASPLLEQVTKSPVELGRTRLFESKRALLRDCPQLVLKTK